MPLIHDPDLNDVLLDAELDDLTVLIDHITDKGEGRITLPASTCAILLAAKKRGTIDTAQRALIAEELSRFGGNSLMNLFRGGGVSYREIARDVADHLKAASDGSDTAAAYEIAILQKLAEQSLSKMSETEKVAFFDQFGMRYAAGSGAAASAGLLAGIAASSSSGFQLSALIANGVVTALLGRGVTVGFGSIAGSAALAGPVAIALSVIWGLYGLTSPAYRVTVPCVIHLAYMRRKRASAHTCRQCGALPVAGARFCSRCGAPIAAVPALAASASAA